MPIAVKAATLVGVSAEYERMFTEVVSRRDALLPRTYTETLALRMRGAPCGSEKDPAWGVLSDAAVILKDSVCVLARKVLEFAGPAEQGYMRLALDQESVEEAHQTLSYLIRNRLGLLNPCIDGKVLEVVSASRDFEKATEIIRNCASSEGQVALRAILQAQAYRTAVTSADSLESVAAATFTPTCMSEVLKSTLAFGWLPVERVNNVNDRIKLAKKEFKIGETQGEVQYRTECREGRIKQLEKLVRDSKLTK